MSVEEEDAREAVCLVPGGWVKDLGEPFIAKVPVRPPVDGFRDTVPLSVSVGASSLSEWTYNAFMVFPLFQEVWKFTPGKIIIGGTTISPSPRIVTSAVMF